MEAAIIVGLVVVVAAIGVAVAMSKRGKTSTTVAAPVDRPVASGHDDSAKADVAKAEASERAAAQKAAAERAAAEKAAAEKAAAEQPAGEQATAEQVPAQREIRTLDPEGPKPLPERYARPAGQEPPHLTPSNTELPKRGSNRSNLPEETAPAKPVPTGEARGRIGDWRPRGR